MLPQYNLIVDISTNDCTISEEQFREQVAPSLAHLDGLKGAFDRSPSTIAYFPPGEQNDSLGWSARGVVMISLGKQRAVYLLQLYKSISDLIIFELPDLTVNVEINKFSFS